MANLSMHTVNNLAEMYGGVKITKAFDELINPTPEAKKTADEIINSFKERLNGDYYESI